ncbi:MAG: ferrous iron transport protein B [Saprospiraceae bacterium]|nr:ferrous iron transport protein B [Pyrinomonadaceae bacterium]
MKKDEQKSNPASNITVALAGNPNAGKTTLFNSLTGLNQRVANYPGVTVERKDGVWKLPHGTAKLIDLPGLYSLDATSLDEQIARDILVGNIDGLQKPDVVIAVVDATNLERNLYLVTQLFDYDIPIVVALTMIDVFEKEKHEIDVEKLSGYLQVAVVEINARSGRGTSELAEKVAENIGNVPKKAFELNGGADAIENGKIFARYNFISNVVQESVKHNDTEEHRISEKIDSVLTHKFFGLIILILILLLVFQAIFSWATLPMDLLESGFGAAGDFVRSQMSEGILTDLLVDGIITGVGGVLIFLPQILLLFLFISVLEDTGYLARAAFLLDKLMSKVGLHGKAFLPLMSSFACAIPGIMATRTIENRRDRFATIMIAPFMSCSARLPVYTLMIAAFFAGQTVFGFISLGAVLMLAMYSLGIVAAVVSAFVLKRTLLKAPPPPFLMELPPYRLPNLRTVLQNMFTRGWLFVKRAGTVILAISIVLWALMYFPRSDQQSAVSGQQLEVSQAAETSQLQNSYAGKLGHFIEPVIRPLGFDWKIGVALIASFAAREVLVSTLSIIYNVGKGENEESETLISAIRDAKKPDGSLVWSPLTALTLMVFFVLAMQCMSTVAVVRRETNSWSWTLFMVVYMTLLAYAAAFVTYQGGRLLGYS